MHSGTDFDRLFAQTHELLYRWELEAATCLLERAREQGNFPNRLHHDLSVLYAQQGFFPEALREIEAAIAREPTNRAVWHHFLALQKNNPVQPSPAQWRAMHLAFGNMVSDRHDERHLEAKRSLEPGRRLRVAYLCPDTHLATERFVWPVLDRFDGDKLEVFAYWCHAPTVEAFEARYPRVSHRTVVGLDDESIVRAIVEDAIDIVVDVAGHGSGNVLTALARRPAPVAITWLDYLATTGMEEVDFRITDGVADPHGAEDAHVERLIRMASPQWCYRPPADSGSPGVRTRELGGAIVFGSVSVPLKLSEPILDVWSRLLDRVPRSRIRFLGVPEGRARTRIVRRLVASGTDPARVEFLPRLAQADFFRELRDLDVVLDSHPFSGATSTLDAIWTGVPVVTFVGPLSHGRSSASILTSIGRKEWVASDPEAFIEAAATLAEDGVRLKREREALRHDLLAAPLCDGDAFAKAMGDALHTAWDGRRTAPARSSRDAATEFWRDLPSTPPRETARGAPGDEWLLITDAALFELATMSPTLPIDLLASFDVLASAGVDALISGDPTESGEGHLRGARLIADAAAGRIYANAWQPAQIGNCVALVGGALLVRKSVLGRVSPPARSTSAAQFRGEVLRTSHQLFLEGARLGISIGLSAAERQWPDARDEFTVARAVETALGLGRWAQEVPAARALKAAFAPIGWQRVVPSLERLCDGPFGS